MTYAEGFMIIPTGQNTRLDAAIRVEAETLAGDLIRAAHVQHGMMSAHTEGAIVEAYIDLLRDLSRPASMDAAARRLAKAVGLECGAVAPVWKRRCLSNTEVQWCIGTEPEWAWFGSSLVVWDRQYPCDLSEQQRINPAAAMIAALLVIA